MAVHCWKLGEQSRSRVDVVVDSTGLKVFGEGEWKMREAWQTKRRFWRKLRLAINPDTHEIVAETMTENSCDDAGLNGSCFLASAVTESKRLTGAMGASESLC